MFVNEVKIEPKSDSVTLQPNSDNCATVNIENIININVDSPQTCATNGDKKSEVPSSPNPSARSTSISIASIESDALSSVIDSDVDEYEDVKTGCMLKKLGQQTSKNQLNNNSAPNVSPEIAVLLSQQIERDVASSNEPVIASLSLTNSTDVTFGHKKYHKGPVTIQQILVEKPKNNGTSNPAFQSSNASLNTRTSTKEPDCAPPENSTASSPYKSFINNKAALITAIIVLSTILIGIVATIFILVLRKDTNDLNSGIKLIQRVEWVAQPPNVPLGNLKTPVGRVIIAHTATQNCTTQPMCIFRTRFIQTFDMESKSYDDIQYNFLIGGDGNVYIGRGWDKVGAHTKGYNDDSVGIAFIGTFSKWKPPGIQLNATMWLLNEGVRLNKLVPNFKLYGSRQLDLTDGPGDALYNIITKWPNFSNVL